MTERPCNRWQHLYAPPQWPKAKLAANIRQWVQRGLIEECACGFYRLIGYEAVPVT